MQKEREPSELGKNAPAKFLSKFKIPKKPKIRLVDPCNIELRILSGIAIVALMTVSILFVPPLFIVMILMIATGMLLEWFEMTKFSIFDLLLGLVIIPAPIISLLLTNIEHDSRWILLSYFVAIWSVDTFAMIGGQNLRGPKLAPKLSPNKTWSGLIIGVVSSGTIVAIISTIPSFAIPHCHLFDKTHLILSCMLIAFIAQMSDLFISYFKRKFNIKESGVLIPGHGGVLDRFDSIILTAPILYLAVHCS